MEEMYFCRPMITSILSVNIVIKKFFELKMVKNEELS